LASGDAEAAERLAHEALALSHDLGYDYWPHGTVDALETIAAAGEDAALAARLFGAVDAGLARAGRVRAKVDRDGYDAAVERLREELGADGFKAAHEEGARLSLDAAVDYARRGRGRRQRPSSGWESLTPTELEVVKLVTEGLTNPQIAERLFISRKTVTTHLTHVFAKLGISTRAALSAEAVRKGAVNKEGTT
jgi:DNA-binding CsgD family transcriptional regulator